MNVLRDGTGPAADDRQRGDADQDRAGRFTPGLLLRGLAWDVGLPLAAYYVLHLLGVADRPALLAATVLAAARIGWDAVRRRSLNVFATVMLLVLGLGLVLGLVSGDPRFLLLKNSVATAAIGLTYLVSVLVGTPLTLAAMQSFQPARRAELRRRYDADPRVRHGHRVSSTVWGAGLLAEALVRVPLVFLLPVSVMVGVGEALTVATFGGLIAWTVRYVRRSRAALDGPETGRPPAG